MSSSTASAKRIRSTASPSSGSPAAGRLGRVGLIDLDAVLDRRRVDGVGADVDVAVPGAPGPDPDRARAHVEQPLEHPVARAHHPVAAAARAAGRASAAGRAPRSTDRSRPSGRTSGRGRGRRPGRCGGRRSSRGGGRGPAAAGSPLGTAPGASHRDGGDAGGRSRGGGDRQRPDLAAPELDRRRASAALRKRPHGLRVHQPRAASSRSDSATGIIAKHPGQRAYPIERSSRRGGTS